MKVLSAYDTPEYHLLAQKFTAFCRFGHILNFLRELGGKSVVVHAILHRFDVFSGGKIIENNTKILSELVNKQPSDTHVSGLSVCKTASDHC